MIRICFFLILFTPLCGFTSMPQATLDPAEPRLGEPFRLIYPLPEPDIQLTGLPDLGSFRLLLPPKIDRSELFLELLPVRSGPASIPALSLHQANRSWRTAPVDVVIHDPVPLDAESKPLQRLPGKAEAPWITDWFWLLLLVPFFLWPLHKLRHRRNEPEKNSQKSSLKQLEEQVQQAPTSEERSCLLQTIRAWRFGPYAPKAEKQEKLREAVAKIRNGGTS